MMGIVARSARMADGATDSIPDEVVATGGTAAEKFLLQWRGEADPRHAKAIDTYWICTAEHGLNASTFTARVTASTGADCGAALSSAVGAFSGPWHGGPRVREADAGGSHRDGRPGALGPTLAAGKPIMGFGHRIYRAEDPGRASSSDGQGAGALQVEVAEQLRKSR
jgi:citrate synthase